MGAKVIVSTEGPLMRVLLNRPEKKNALDREMYEALIEALEFARDDFAVRAVLLSGAGGAFTAGNDLNDFDAVIGDPATFPALRFVRALARFQKPVVAAVEGDAVGVGTTLLFHCDLVYATQNARFKMPFVDLGVAPEAASSLLVPRRIGRVKAAQFLLLCEAFGAEEALRLGIINAIAPADEVLKVAADAALRLCDKPPEALAAARRLLRGDEQEIIARIDEEGALFLQLLATPETKARLAAFFASRRSK
jgi:enoyl-CoA hydratase/carnithine racemase